MELYSGCPGWAVAQYKTRYLDSLAAWRFSAVFPDGRNRTMFYHHVVLRGTGMGPWKRRWTVLRLWRHGYFSPISLFEMPFVRHACKLECKRSLRRSLDRSESFWRVNGFDFDLLNASLRLSLLGV